MFLVLRDGIYNCIFYQYNVNIPIHLNYENLLCTIKSTDNHHNNRKWPVLKTQQIHSPKKLKVQRFTGVVYLIKIY